MCVFMLIVTFTGLKAEYLHVRTCLEVMFGYSLWLFTTLMQDYFPFYWK